MRVTIFSLVLLLHSIPHIAQHADIHGQYDFRFINIDQGLSNNIVNSICEDANGYIWVATALGLNKLSGIEIENFLHEPNKPHSLPSHRIYSLFCDSRGIVWIGSENGICTYAESINGFINRTDSILKNASAIYDIEEDAEHNLWFATESGLYKYLVSADSFLLFNHRNTDLPNTGIYRLLNDTTNHLWLSIYPRGIRHFNTKSKEVNEFDYTYEGNNHISDSRIERMYKDRKGRIWLGTYDDGAFRYDPKNKSFTKLYIDPENPYSTRVRVFFEDRHNVLFVAARSGLYRYNEAKNSFYLYANTKHQFSKLSANSLLCSYIDSANGLWLGTKSGGVNYANLDKKPFITYTSAYRNRYFLNNPRVFGIGEDAQGQVYICTERGINILNRQASKFSYLEHDPDNNNSLSFNNAKSIAVLPNGNFWAGTNKGGLNYYHAKTKRFTHYRHKAGDSTSLAGDKVYLAYLDSQKDLWLISNEDRYNQSSVVSLLKKDSRQFKNFYGNFFHGITEDERGNILIGCYAGLFKMLQALVKPKDSVSMRLFNKDNGN